MRIRVIDAFTDRPFTGNPAGVCLLDEDDWPDEAWMRHVAAEVALPMTAFAHPLPGDGEADWALRWFTPVIEERICGHATLATAYALHSDGAMAETVRFATRAGVLLASPAADGAITLDFPAAPVSEIAVPDGLAQALGAPPLAAFRAGALRDVLAVFDDERLVRALSPDLDAVARLQRRDDIRGITATALADDPAGGYDFVSRFFSPLDGVPEDPVTGSAHTALAPYWAGRLGRDELVGLQASARGGLVGTAVRGDRVHLTGHAVTVLDGELLAAPSRA